MPTQTELEEAVEWYKALRDAGVPGDQTLEATLSGGSVYIKAPNGSSQIRVRDGVVEVDGAVLVQETAAQTAAATTLTCTGGNVITIANAEATTITAVAGVAGQIVTLLAADGNTTLTDNAAIVTGTGENLALAADAPVQFLFTTATKMVRIL